ncbi:hypothetical protein KKH23_07535 [Patescibacteria group bacterium]|nr:hypothetical protein [Patescibacteria group bacterium]
MATQNPYPETLIDEASGVVVTDIRHEVWEQGYRVGYSDKSKEVGKDKPK